MYAYMCEYCIYVEEWDMGNGFPTELRFEQIRKRHHRAPIFPHSSDNFHEIGLYRLIGCRLYGCMRTTDQREESRELFDYLEVDANVQCSMFVHSFNGLPQCDMRQCAMRKRTTRRLWGGLPPLWLSSSEPVSVSKKASRTPWRQSPSVGRRVNAKSESHG